MPQLLMLRHAKSSWDDPALTDHARPLNPRGERAARAMAKAFAQLKLAPDLALVSSSRRTLQTFQALRLNEEAVEVEASDALYLADVDAIFDRLRAVPDGVQSVLLVAHNPGLYEAAVALVGDLPATRPEAPVMRLLDGYATASLAEFVVAVPWREIGPGRGRLVRFQRPEDFDAGSAGDDDASP